MLAATSSAVAIAYAAPGDMSDSNSNAMSSQVERISENALGRCVTANHLMGKDVYDNQGKKIGEVKDVVVTGQGSTLSQMNSKKTDSDDLNSASDTGSAKNLAMANDSGSDMNSSSSSDDLNHSSSTTMNAAGGMALPAVIISYGGFLGMGNNLLRVPLNQLNYDKQKDRLTLNVSESEIKNLPSTSSSSGHYSKSN
jgi:sporulation protein YlmC with PRC-barrel domain